MTKRTGTFASLALLLMIAVVTSGPASAQQGLLGVSSNWSAFSTGSGSSLTCYAISKPRATQPRTAKRNAIYLMVSDWPGRKVKAEPQIVFGYEAKEGGEASLGIGGDKFNFFIRNSGKEGSAWLQSLNDNPRLIDAMRNGVSAVTHGVSKRGTKTVDTYSLSGFNDALARIHAACGM